MNSPISGSFTKRYLMEEFDYTFDRVSCRGQGVLVQSDKVQLGENFVIPLPIKFLCDHCLLLIQYGTVTDDSSDKASYAWWDHIQCQQLTNGFKEGGTLLDQVHSMNRILISASHLMLVSNWNILNKSLLVRVNCHSSSYACHHHLPRRPWLHYNINHISEIRASIAATAILADLLVAIATTSTEL